MYDWEVETITRLHGGKVLTGQEMYRLAKTYAADIGGHAFKSLPTWFRFVRDLAYQTDAKLTGGDDEVLARPRYLLDPSVFPALDCKKKAILIAAWCESQNPPVLYRFIATSEKPSKEIHHVFTQVRKYPGWLNVDPTFSSFRLGEGKTETTFAQELLP